MLNAKRKGTSNRIIVVGAIVSVFLLVNASYTVILYADAVSKAQDATSLRTQQLMSEQAAAALARERAAMRAYVASPSSALLAQIAREQERIRRLVTRASDPKDAGVMARAVTANDAFVAGTGDALRTWRQP